MNTLTVVGAVLDTQSLTLYVVKDNKASQVIIPQGDKRLQPLLDAVLPQLSACGKAAINAALLETAAVNTFTEMEKKTNGFVRFFAIARSKLKALLGESDEPKIFGSIPPTQQEVVAAIMAQAEPIDSTHELEVARPLVDSGNHTASTHPARASEHTVIAVVDNIGVVPNAELLQNHFNHAIQNTAKGTQALLERMARLQETRQHTVQDLLTFLERADIPIMDDGSLLVYKILQKAPTQFANTPSNTEIFVDCHSKRVPQWVGAVVQMDAALVDGNRSVECSHGLHIARRGYLGRFHGNVCVLAKVNPEDIIAVPTHDANKVRVCAYHILHQLSDAQATMVKANRHLTADTEGQVLLGRLLTGNYAAPTHTVTLHTANANANSISIHALAQTQAPVLQEPVVIPLVQALPDDVTKVAAPHVAIKEVLQKTRKQHAEELLQKYQISQAAEDLQALLDLKKRARVSWETLGIADPLGTKKTETIVPITHRERISSLMKSLTAEGAVEIMLIKKRSKKSWNSLGITDAMVETIKNKLPK